MRLSVHRVTHPPLSLEEEPNTALVLTRMEGMHHMHTSQILPSDYNPNLFLSLPDHPIKNRLARLQAPRRQACPPVLEPSVRPHKQQNLTVRPTQDQIDVHEMPSTLTSHSGNPNHQSARIGLAARPGWKHG